MAPPPTYETLRGVEKIVAAALKADDPNEVIDEVAILALAQKC